MATCSNQNLWKILIGHSSLRDPDLIFDEVSTCSQRLKEGLAYYKEPNSASENELQKSKVKGDKLRFILEISKHLHLNQMLSVELFQASLGDTHQSSFAELSKKLTKEKERHKLVAQILKYYISERRHLLRCVKHLFGYWQDSSHPYRETYEKCIHLLEAGQHKYIEGVLKQYEKCANSEIPTSVKDKEEQNMWLLANLHEQCELLEIVLLYHKDYQYPLPNLLDTAKLFQSLGFGVRFRSQLGQLPAAKVLMTHISHLCGLILVEGMDLDLIYGHQDNPHKYNLADHHMLNPNLKSQFKELDSLVSEWGEMSYHAPILLAWTVFKFMTHFGTDLEQTQLLGNKALQVNVFGYLNEMLDSPFFAGDRPVSNICRSIVHVLLSTCVTAFSENSLGDPMILISVATKSLNHPRLCLEFWTKGLDSGAGLLLSSALKRFPLDLTSVLQFLEPLAMDESSAQSVFCQLCQMEYYTDDFAHISSDYVNVGRRAGSWVVTRQIPFYLQESRQLGLPEFVLPIDTEGVVSEPENDLDQRQIISWRVCYSAWDLFALITCSLFHSPGIGIDPSPSPLIDDVAAIAKLVTQVLKHDWSAEAHLRSITSQYYILLQKFSPLPHPPSLLLAECLKCISVMAANNPQLVWQQLGRTGFLPHIISAGSSIETIGVALGHYGQLMNSWERPRGIYPISMAMLDLLLCSFPPNGGVAGSAHEGGGGHDVLACVILIMREMFAGSHSWRYRHSSNRDQIGYKLLQLCHVILIQPRGRNNEGYSVVEFVQHFLLHSVGSHSLLSTLSLSLDTVNALYSSRLSVSTPVLQVESLKLAFKVIDLLLLTKANQTPTPLEQALATQSVKCKTDHHSLPSPVHLVAVIASYIHHHDDAHVPAGATKLLMRLSQVAPMSVFACLGSESTTIRDAYIHRLKSHVEDTELKVAILKLVTECVSSQPGMMELFLSIQPAPPDSAKKPTKNKAEYILGQESCLHIVMDFIKPEKPTPPPLMQSALLLLRNLWVGRHDAALIALRAQKDFWKHLTHPLFQDLQQSENNWSDVDYLIPCHVIYIVSLETYYVMKNMMDAELVQVLKDFTSKGRYLECLMWFKALPQNAAESAVEAQLQLAQAWSTFLCVGSTNERLFHLSETKLHECLLQEILYIIHSQLDPTSPRISMATELSILYTVLLRKWKDECMKFDGVISRIFIDILSRCALLEPNSSLEIITHLYTCLIQIFSVLRTSNKKLESKFVLDLIPILEETFKNHSTYVRMKSKHRPDIIAVYLLNEMVGSLTSDLLEVLNQHSILGILGNLLGEHLNSATDSVLVAAIFSFFISIASFKSGAEALLMNRVNHHVNISLANNLALSKEWTVIWQQGLQLMSTLLHSLSHQFLTHALDFVGVYQEKLILALDIYHVIKDLTNLDETKYVCQFLFSLSLFKHQWRFSMPLLHSDLMERLIFLAASAVAVVSKTGTLKQIVKTMNAAGFLAPEDGPLGALKGKGKRGTHVRTLSGNKEGSLPSSSVTWFRDGKMEQDDSWVMASSAFARLQDGLVSILTSSLAALRHYVPPLGPMIMEGGVDLVEYAPIFSLSLAPPTVQMTTHPSLATLITCLSTGVNLMNKLEPRSGTPSRSPIKSPPFVRSSASIQKRAEYLFFLEQAVILLLSQATRYLIDPAVLTHDKLKLKTELANELGNFSTDLLRNFTRRGAPSPGGIKVTPPSKSHTLHQSSTLQDSFSGKANSLVFSDTSEQAVFKLADSFSKQLFR